jgi:hypothetical protein
MYLNVSPQIANKLGNLKKLSKGPLLGNDSGEATEDFTTRPYPHKNALAARTKVQTLHHQKTTAL